jgi:hypothetical protein
MAPARRQFDRLPIEVAAAVLEALEAIRGKPKRLDQPYTVPRTLPRGPVGALSAGRRRPGAEDDFGVGVCDAEFESKGSQQDVELGRVVACDTQLVVRCAGQVEHFADRTECAAQGCERVRVGARQQHHRDECFDLAASGGWIDLRGEAGDDACSAQSSNAVGCSIGTEADFGAEFAPG